MRRMKSGKRHWQSGRGLPPSQRIRTASLILLGLGLFPGCTISDDLEVVNTCSFPIILKRSFTDTGGRSHNSAFGVVPANTACTFMEAAGRHGLDLDQITVEDQGGEVIARLNRTSTVRVRQGGGCARPRGLWRVAVPE